MQPFPSNVKPPSYQTSEPHTEEQFDETMRRNSISDSVSRRSRELTDTAQSLKDAEQDLKNELLLPAHLSICVNDTSNSKPISNTRPLLCAFDGEMQDHATNYKKLLLHEFREPLKKSKCQETNDKIAVGIDFTLGILAVVVSIVSSRAAKALRSKPNS